jgi:hypothetical protein
MYLSVQTPDMSFLECQSCLYRQLVAIRIYVVFRRVVVAITNADSCTLKIGITKTFKFTRILQFWTEVWHKRYKKWVTIFVGKPEGPRSWRPRRRRECGGTGVKRDFGVWLMQPTTLAVGTPTVVASFYCVTVKCWTLRLVAKRRSALGVPSNTSSIIRQNNQFPKLLHIYYS